MAHLRQTLGLTVTVASAHPPHWRAVGSEGVTMQQYKSTIQTNGALQTNWVLQHELFNNVSEQQNSIQAT